MRLQWLAFGSLLALLVALISCNDDRSNPDKEPAPMIIEEPDVKLLDKQFVGKTVGELLAQLKITESSKILWKNDPPGKLYGITVFPYPSKPNLGVEVRFGYSFDLFSAKGSWTLKQVSPKKIIEIVITGDR